MANSKSGAGTKAKSAKPKHNSTKKSSPSKNTDSVRTSAAKRQRAAIILMASAIFLICVSLFEGSNVWTLMHDALLGLFGYCAYVWPVMLIYMAIVYALDKPLGSITANLVGIAFFIVLIGGSIHIFRTKSIETVGLWDQIQQAWSSQDDGGAFGALVGGFLAILFGQTGARITVVILLIVTAMLLTGTTLYGVFHVLSKPVKKVNKLTEEKIEQRNRKREEAEAGKAYGEDAKKPFNPPRVLSNDELDTADEEAEFIPAISETPIPVTYEFFAGEHRPEPAADVLKPEGLEAILNKAASKKKSEPKPVQQTEEKHDDDIFEVFKTYRLPPIDCLAKPRTFDGSGAEEELKVNGQKLIETLQSFGVQAKIVMISRGPSVTRYELQPNAGVRISKITNLADDIAMRLAASGVRIEAPIPNKSAIGIEVPNIKKASVSLREIIDTAQYRSAKSKLNVALGKDITGNVVCTDLVKMPHLLIAGTTGSGKSVCLNAMIVSILYNATPDEVKLLMIDPKQVEFSAYNGIAHMEVPVVSDPRKAAGALGWAVSEMQNRYKLLAEKGVKDISGYNKLADKIVDMKRMHHIVIFIDELSDLMMVAPNEVEDSIIRLAQMARAAGMHLVIATQRPSVDVITGIIKANIPSRIALAVSSQVDSRTILDMAGAEKLVGNGDMLFNPVGISKPVRIQGCYVSEQEVENVVGFIKSQSETAYDEDVMQEIERHAAATKKKGAAANSEDEDDEDDEMLPKAIEVVVEAQMASTTLLQRKLKLGYARAARIVDALEEKGIVGPFEGSKPRKVLISKQQWMEMSALAED